MEVVSMGKMANTRAVSANSVRLPSQRMNRLSRSFFLSGIEEIRLSGTRKREKGRVKRLEWYSGSIN